MSAIKISVKKAKGEYDLGSSKMLGNPTLPEGMEEDLPKSAMFLMQIRLSDIKELDNQNILPHKGYLYFFLDVENGIYDMKPIVKYYDGEPTYHIEGFNEIVDGFEEYIDDYIIEFSKCEDDESGSKLLGSPSDWQYADEPNSLLFQLDPLDNNDMNLFSNFDGFIYFFFGKDKSNFDDIELVTDFS